MCTQTLAWLDGAVEVKRRNTVFQRTPESPQNINRGRSSNNTLVRTHMHTHLHTPACTPPLAQNAVKTHAHITCKSSVKAILTHVPASVKTSFATLTAQGAQNAQVGQADAVANARTDGLRRPHRAQVYRQSRVSESRWLSN